MRVWARRAYATVIAKYTKLDLTFNAVVILQSTHLIAVFSGYSYIFGNEKLYFWDRTELLG